MTLALAFALLVLTVPLTGGRLSSLETIRLRWLWLAFVAFGVQVVLVTVVPSGDAGLHRILHLATYALVGACVLRNLDLRFLWVAAVGGLLNLIAILANGGVMPASRGPARDRWAQGSVGFVRELGCRGRRSSFVPRRRVRGARGLAGRERVQRGRRGDAGGAVPRGSRGSRLAASWARTKRAPAIPRITSSAIAVMASGEVRSPRLPPSAV
jgi:hypothetical protein